jgi:hypothetical protein
MSLYQIVTLPHKLVRVCYARLAVLHTNPFSLTGAKGLKGSRAKGLKGYRAQGLKSSRAKALKGSING